MTKIQTVISEMYEKYQQEFADFQITHDKFMRDRKTFQRKYNREGRKIMEILRFYEGQLCGKQERSSMGVYSSKLAEKYWTEIKKKLPLIDFVGVKIS